MSSVFFFFQAEDGIRDLVRSRGLGDVYKRQNGWIAMGESYLSEYRNWTIPSGGGPDGIIAAFWDCLFYTSDAADERSSVDFGGRRIL